MPPKEKEGKAKSKPLGPKPVHLSDEQWALANSVPKLVEVLATPDKHSARGPRALATRAQAGLWLWQYLASQDSGRRDEGLKAGCIELCAKLINGQDQQVATAAAGIVQALILTEQAREALCSARPSVLNNMTSLLSSDSTSLVAGSAGILRLLAQAPDTRARVMKAVACGAYLPLLAATKQQMKLPLMGGRSACCDATAVLEAVCSVPGEAAGDSGSNGKEKGSKDKGGAKDGDAAADKALMESVQRVVLGAGGLGVLLEVCKSHHSTAPAKASAVSTLYTLLRTHGLEASTKAAFAEQGGIQAMVKMMSHAFLPLITRAHAAGCLLHFLQPKPSVLQSSAALLSNITANTDLIQAANNKGLQHSDSSLANAEAGATAAAGSASTTGDAPYTVTDVQSQSRAGLDQEGQSQLMARLASAAEAGVVPALLQLCLGPEGPLPEVTRPEELEPKLLVDTPIAEEGEEGDAATDDAGSAAAPTSKPKKGKKKGASSKKKKAKLEPGMAEAQILASACLRLMSLSEGLRSVLVSAASVRYLLPLVTGSVHVARWNARQTLLNLSILPNSADMALYDAPKFICNDNVPKTHYQPIERTSLPAALRELDLRVSSSQDQRASSALSSARRTSRDGMDPAHARRGSDAGNGALNGPARAPRQSTSAGDGAPPPGLMRRTSISGRVAA